MSTPDSYAAEWRRQGSARRDAFAAVTDVMLERAQIAPGMRVLDVGAGMGDQSIAAARRVGPDGSVLATDSDPEMLKGAAEAIQDAGLENVELRIMDAQSIQLAPSSFDAVIGRNVLMLLPDPARMAAGVFRVLRPGARFAGTVFSLPERNWLLAEPLSIARHAGNLPEPDPREPGMFALAEPGAAAALLTTAGFSDVTEEKVELPIRFPSVAAGLNMMREGFPPLRALMAELTEGQQQQAWHEIQAALAALDSGSAVSLPGELLVVAGTR